MASTILTPPKQQPSEGYGGGGHGPGSNGFGGGGDSGLPEYRVPGHTYQLGMWFALVGIFMLFAGFTSAMVVRRGMSFDWVSIAMPRLLWVNTGILLASSLTLEFSRHALKQHAEVNFLRWLGGDGGAWGRLSGGATGGLARTRGARGVPGHKPQQFVLLRFDRRARSPLARWGLGAWLCCGSRRPHGPRARAPHRARRHGHLLAFYGCALDLYFLLADEVGVEIAD